MRYRLITLGSAVVTDSEGSPLDFPAGKPLGILIYLSLADRPVPRDDLATLFWGQSDRARARHSLRQALSFIRQRLGEDVFDGDDPISLDPAVIGSDVDLLLRALEAWDIDGVLERFTGAFLDTFQPSASGAWDRWVEARRRAIDERVAAMLRDAADASPSRAVELLRRVVEIEPHRIQHRAALVDRLLDGGAVVEASAVVAETRRADLGAPEALAELESRIRSVREARRAAGEGSELRPEFVGRAAELASLTALWREALRGRRQVAIISGPTGIGKTRLAEELAIVIGASGRMLHLKAAAAERRLEGSLTAELIQALYALPGGAGVGSSALSALQSLVPSLGGKAVPTPMESPRPVALSDALADLVAAVAYEAPLLIILDDLQWADRSSLTVLLRAVRQVRNEPVMAVLTFRSEELPPRDRNALLDLADKTEGLRIRLRTLAASEVQEMLALEIQEPAHRVDALARRLHDITRGQPLFLVELLRSLRDDDVLVPTDGGWKLGELGPVELELPASVQLVISKRLDRLGRDARRLGTELAAMPPRVGLARARTRTGLSDAAFTRALNELVDRAVVTWDPAGHVVFTHDQLREAMAEQRPSRPGRRWLVAAILVLVLAVTLLTIRSRGAPRYGGGTILVTAGDSVVALTPAGPVDRWDVGPSPVWYPAHPDIFGLPRARRLTNGRVVWFSSVLDLVEAPEGAVFWGRDSTTVFEWPGDDGIKDISPGGRYVLWATEDRSTREYDMTLRAAPSTGRSPGRPLTRAASAVDGLWSPDGTRIAVVSQRAQDSLWIMSPRGDRLLDHSAFSLRLEEWCGASRLMALRRETPTSPAERIVIDVRGGSETSLRSPAIGGAACSPDGTAFISQELQEDGPALVLTELETGRRYTLPERTVVSGRILWIPDRVSPVPVALEVAADSVRLERGSGTRLQAAVRLTDGSLRGARVRWRSTDPDIASVLSDGTLLANRPGQVRLVAEFARWLTDTVAVRVEAGGGETLVLTDDFRELRPDRWDLLGFPTVRPARVDSQPVLELLGDGRYRDGLISHEARTFPTGVTAEMEFQLPLTRNEYQGIYFGLTTADPPPDSAYRAKWMSWEDRRSVQASLTAYETDKWSPRLIGLRSSALSEAIAELPATTDPGQWTHIAIQIRPDGLASLWVDRHKISETQAPRSFLEEPLRVFIFGRTRDTYGYVRSFAWWSEPRYR